MFTCQFATKLAKQSIRIFARRKPFDTSGKNSHLFDGAAVRTVPWASDFRI
jgi:hypothetical protein